MIILFQVLKTFSQQRLSWLLLLLFTAFFELCALFFQHVMLLQPCVMCIYERVAMLGIAAAALIGLIYPKNFVLRITSLLMWILASAKGYLLATQHVEYQMNPSPFATCDVFVQFPSWAPLNQWADWMFEAYGDCSEIVWQWLELSMPQWLVIIYAANVVVGLIFLTVQFSKR